MKLRSNGRSTLLPRILKAHLDLDRLLSLADEDQRQNRISNRSARAGARAKVSSARRMSCGVRLAPAVAHEGVIDGILAIDARAAEFADRARRPSPPPASRRWGRRCARVAPSGAPGLARRSRRHRSDAASDQKQRASREAGRLTRSSSRADAQPKIHERVRAMADHAVGGVDRLIKRAAGETAERQPKGGRDDAIGKILGEAFDRGAGDAGLVERLGLAADDRADGARPPQVRCLQRVGDGGDMLIEASLRGRLAARSASSRKSGSEPRQSQSDEARNQAAVTATAKKRGSTRLSGAKVPADRLAIEPPSVAAINAPIQVTGWPIRRRAPADSRRRPRWRARTRGKREVCRRNPWTETITARLADRGCAAPLSWRRSRRSAAGFSRGAGALDRSFDRRQSHSLSFRRRRCRSFTRLPRPTRSQRSKRPAATAYRAPAAQTLLRRRARRRSSAAAAALSGAACRHSRLHLWRICAELGRRAARS